MSTVIDGILVAIPPPPGYVVDFAHPRRRCQTSTYIMSSIGTVLAAAMMGQRLYVKAVVRRKLGIDDYSFQQGFLGVHAWELPFSEMRRFGVFEIYINSIVYTVPSTLAKIVILLFFRDIPNSQTSYQYSIWIMIFVVGSSGIAILFASMFSCHPFRKNWDIMLYNVGSCINRQAMYKATAGISLTTDIFIFMIPIPMVVGLKMSRSKKVGLIILFAIGSVTVVTSMVRLTMLINAVEMIDQTWGGAPICLWICIEANLLITCASLSTLNQFVKVILPKLLLSVDESAVKSCKATSPSRHELRTFGSVKPRGRENYNRFDTTVDAEMRSAWDKVEEECELRV